ncbi:hypothetical protein GYH73_015920 [Bacillus megaterium]|nr:hypothetical protein [Priestia megaterium]
MKWLHLLFNERCPKCKQVLNTSKSNALRSTVVKVCPSNHYQKNFILRLKRLWKVMKYYKKLKLWEPIALAFL